MNLHCPDCLEPVAASPNARDGRCSRCRPLRRRSRPGRTHWRDRADEQFRQLINQDNPIH
ncbi:MAG: hypothetical protein M3R02_27650 [Chloroflexota bacterium]|nr:hypothetical protein [Chloroflexota bacterium]MDP9459463.1 hypothetical protein [Actinomycetota bacterium]